MLDDQAGLDQGRQVVGNDAVDTLASLELFDRDASDEGLALALAVQVAVVGDVLVNHAALAAELVGGLRLTAESEGDDLRGLGRLGGLGSGFGTFGGLGGDAIDLFDGLAGLLGHDELLGVLPIRARV